MAEEKVTKHSGYVYNKKTSEGFKRMKKRGIAMPPFRIEDDVTKILTNHYDRLIKKIAVSTQAVGLINQVVTDSLEGTIANLQEAMLKAISADKRELLIKLSKQLAGAKRQFFDDFIDDAPGDVGIATQFALDKDSVFNERINRLQETFLKTSLERIEREENFLKSAFLQDLSKYVLGEQKDLKSLESVIKGMRKTSVREARFFARDQFARLNKAMTLASLENAGATKVRWMTVGDGRVRPTHKALNKKVFHLDALPKEKDDYNCRCGFYPIFED